MAEIVQLTKTIFMSIKDFVAQTGKAAFVVSLLPLLVSVCLRLSTEDIADMYLGRDRTLIPPIWTPTNTTCVPYRIDARWQYAIPPPGALPRWHLWWNWTVALLLYLLYFGRVLLLLKTNRAGKTAGLFLTLALAFAHGLIWQKQYEYSAERGIAHESRLENATIPANVIIAFAFPSIFVICYFFSGMHFGSVNCLKSVSILFLIGIFESVMIYIVNSFIFEMFFAPDTGMSTRFLIRLGTPLIMKNIFTEGCAVMVPFLCNILETGIHPLSVALFGPVGFAADLIGRLMQSSGESTSEGRWEGGRCGLSTFNIDGLCLITPRET
jgi:hypothetical protein